MRVNWPWNRYRRQISTTGLPFRPQIATSWW